MSLGILLVDPQLDFFPGGSLGVADGDAIVAPINELLARHPEAPVFVTRDWHPEGSAHFAARGGPWPPHCVQGSSGATFHAGLRLPAGARVYSKGTGIDDDGGYSGFDGRAEGSGHTLLEDLAAAGVDTLLVGGLATDYCVRATVLDARKHGLATFVFLPAIRAVELAPGDGARALDEMAAAGAYLVER